MAKIETIFFENDLNILILSAERLIANQKATPWMPSLYQCVDKPACATRKGVGAEVYDGYRMGLVSSCADVVLIQERRGKPMIPLIRRANPPFANTWWMMGGAIFNYRSVTQFLLWKASKECGLHNLDIDQFVETFDLDDDSLSCCGINLIGPLGLYRTAAQDTVDKACDTINICYAATFTGSQELYHDRDHLGIRWMSQEELVPGSCGHWYPEHVGRRALMVYQRALNSLALGRQ